MQNSPRIAIVGAGFSGLAMAIQLKRAGLQNFTVFEKSPDVGGTWLANDYPGSACDVPSFLYSYSFEPRGTWSRKYAPQSEILDYIRHCVRKYGIARHLRCGTEVRAACHDTRTGGWTLEIGGASDEHFDYLVSACGQLRIPRIPALPGHGSFQGTSFHSAEWDHRHDLKGKHVAVIGTGASALQLVPQVAKQAASLQVFQRSPAWIFARSDRPYSRRAQRLLARGPLQRPYRYSMFWSLEARMLGFLQGSRLGTLFERGASMHLQRQLGEPGDQRAHTPDYPIGCKRVLLSDDYYPAFERPNVELVTSGVARLEPDAILRADGTRARVDTIIYATGFESEAFMAPLRIEGRGGRTLEQRWKEGAEAHLGLTVPGFPNFFMLFGPNTNLGHNSVIFMAECQVQYVLRCIEHARDNSLRSMDIKPEAMRRSNSRLLRAMQRTNWVAGCENWYTNDAGKVINNWPLFASQYWLATRRPDFRDFRASPAARPARPEAGEGVRSASARTLLRAPRPG